MIAELDDQIANLINNDDYDEINLDEVIELITKGGNVNISNHEGESAIFIAISTGRLDLVEKLIELGVDLGKQNNSQETPLHAALDTENQAISLAIVKAERDVNDSTNYNEETPIWIALHKGFIDVARILLDRGADVNIGKKDIVANAVLSGNIGMVAKVLAAGGDVDGISDDRLTPIQHALKDECGNDNIKIAALLLLYQAETWEFDVNKEYLTKAENLLRSAMQKYKKLNHRNKETMPIGTVKMSAKDMLTLYSYMQMDNKTTINSNNISMSVSNARAQQHIDEPQAKRAKYL